MNMTTNTTTPSVQDVLKQKSGSGKKGGGKWKGWLATIVVLLAVGAAAWYFLNPSTSTARQVFTTEAVKRGDLKTTITATGNLQPLNQVDIGTELSGTVDTVLVDTNDEVKKGQELARLNTTQLQDTITKNKASLASAEAKVIQAKATVKESQLDLNRLRQLYKSSGGKLPARSDLDSAEATLDRAQADEAVAKTTVVSSKAELSSSQTNLSKAIITSPIDGVVLSREVEPGQTVAASLSAPTLFTLAEDLAKMELQVSVDEADVGQVKEGQSAEFTVDAWAGRKYNATITRVSLGSTTTNNVVSYVTNLNVENTDLTLRPGMTATATITTQQRAGVLLVPNAALRFTPDLPEPPAGMATPDGTAPANNAAPAQNSGGGIISQLMPRPPMMNKQSKSNGSSSKSLSNSEQKLWVLDDNGFPRPIDVKTGITDGKQTEILSGDLQADMKVITGSTSSGGEE